MRFDLPVLCCAFVVLTCIRALAGPPPSTLLLSTYPQRLSDRYTTRDGLPGKRVLALYNDGKALYAQTDLGQAVFEDGKWRTLESNRQKTFYATSNNGIKTKVFPPEGPYSSIAFGPNDEMWFASMDGQAFRETHKGEKLPITKPNSYLTNQPVVNVDAKITCLAADSLGHIWIGTNAGIYATDGKNWWNPIDQRNGLPYCDVTCLRFGKNGEIWVGTKEGVCRYTEGGEWQYYWGPRWLPDNRVNGIVVDKDGAAWVATDGGVARLYDKPITLAQKAAHYETITARHNRYGFVTGSALKKPGDPSGGIIFEASDNDGLWTSLYVGAEAYRYAVTKDPEARALAKKSMWAMLDLMKYSGVPGYPARAIFRKDEKDVSGFNPNETVRIPGEKDKIWYTSPVDPNLWCKGDTSSDETDGHYYAYYLYHELVADAAEKAEIAKATRALTDNILNHDLTLVGHTGRKTRWGLWHPKYMNDDPMWWEERGLNALEILAYLKIAEHICHEPKYGEKYRELITRHHYLLNTIEQKVTEPWYKVNHSDDEMAFMMYYTLMMLEKDPDTRRILVRSIERSWKAEQPEASPFFNFVYGAVTGRPCDTEASVATLQDWPWELVEWQMRGTHRTDVTLLSTVFEGEKRVQTTRALPASERRLMRWNGNPYECDGGSPDGSSEEDAAVWLLPYWMGRYHGFIAEK